MELTGTAGQILGYAMLITAYAIVILGLFCIWSWIWIELIVKRVMIWLRVYEAFIQFMLDHRRYKADKRKKLQQKEGE